MLRLLVKRLLSHLPSKLPVGLKAYNKFCDDIIELSGPFADRDSMLFAISNIITHVKHDVDAVPKAYFVKCMRKAAANQVAGQIFLDIKQKQEAARAEEQAKQKQAEATAPSDVVADASTANQV